MEAGPFSIVPSHELEVWIPAPWTCINVFENGGQQAVTSYLVENDLEFLHELLVGGFSKDDIDFGRILNSVMDEGEIEEI